MKWRKLGLVYCPNGSREWDKSYALIPTLGHITESAVRIYFASLDNDRYGRIGYVDLDPKDPTKVIAVGDRPVLDLGDRGCFDDSGVNPSCMVQVGSENFLYYIGWQRCERVPYMLYAGAARLRPNGSFDRVSRAPVLDRTDREPYLRSATTILKVGDLYRCWYVSARGWTVVGDILYPEYTIRTTTSTDGLNWSVDSTEAIPFQSEAEFGFGRPWVVNDHGIYKMFYCIRSRKSPYALGYAESSDGIHWTRKDDQVGLFRSSNGWDSEMICYPCVADILGKRYMFYNGNRHGSTGFGVAILEQT